MAVVLHTHAAIWYVFSPKKLSSAVLSAIRHAINGGRPVHVSAISMVETAYLVERGRVSFEARTRLESALKDSASALVVTPVDAAVAEFVYKVPRDIVPDMPDRIIAATALVLNAPLVTRDQRIQSAGIKTIW